MMRTLRPLALFLGLVLPLAAGPSGFGDGRPSIAAARAAGFETSAITIITVRGRFPMTVEMALTPDQHRQGLQYRRSLAADAGMLFDFGRTEPASMWMLNTPIPLDMVFLDDKGWVVHIVEKTTPLSLDTISSGGPVRAVLEVNGGTAERLGIRKGARVLHPIFGNP